MGLVVTSRYVVNNLGANYRIVTNDQRLFDVTKILKSADSDIALLRTNAVNTTWLTLDAAHMVKPGRAVAVVGVGDSVGISVGLVVDTGGTVIIRGDELTRDVVTFNKEKRMKADLASQVDAVVVATPGSTHAAVALPFIRQGVPTFIEKPMATSLSDASRLCRAVDKSGTTVFVGHIHLYNEAFLKMKELAKEAGKIRTVHFEGMNDGPIRDDMSVLWDWGPHGVSMILDLLGKKPTHVQGWGYLGLRPKD